MAFTKLIDLELDDENKIDAVMPYAMAEKPDYPYGLRICLTHVELEKLGFTASDFKNGDYLDMRCFGTVTCVSTTDGDGGESSRVEIQIEKFAMEDEMSEAEG